MLRRYCQNIVERDRAGSPQHANEKFKKAREIAWQWLTVLADRPLAIPWHGSQANSS